MKLNGESLDFRVREALDKPGFEPQLPHYKGSLSLAIHASFTSFYTSAKQGSCTLCVLHFS